MLSARDKEKNGKILANNPKYVNEMIFSHWFIFFAGLSLFIPLAIVSSIFSGFYHFYLLHIVPAFWSVIECI